MKLFGTKKVRTLSLVFALVMAFGLFAGCSSKDQEPSGTPSAPVSETPSPEPSADPSEAPSEEPSDTADPDASGEPSDDPGELRNVVGKVTKIDGSVVTLTLYTTGSEEEIENYSKVDMSQYTATEETDEVDLADAWIALAEADGLTKTDLSQIKEGDMLLMSYNGDPGTLLQAVIYAA